MLFRMVEAARNDPRFGTELAYDGVREFKVEIKANRSAERLGTFFQEMASRNSPHTRRFYATLPVPEELPTIIMGRGKGKGG